MEVFPKELHKKVILLTYFKDYFEDRTKVHNLSVNKIIIKNNEYDLVNKDNPFPYVKQWLSTKHGILFYLSNKIMQVIFIDKTEFIISRKSRIVIYFNEKGEKMIYNLDNVININNNPEMTNRLKYIKELMKHMLKYNSKS